MDNQNVQMSVEELGAMALPVDNSASWILLEEDGNPNYLKVISQNQVVGDMDLAQNKIQYLDEGTVKTGIMHFVSTDRKSVEAEQESMVSDLTNLEFPEFWALVKKEDQEGMVQIQITECKVSKENGQVLLCVMGEDSSKIKILDMLASEQELRDVLKNILEQMMSMSMCDGKDHEVESVGLGNAYFLVQYYVDALTAVFCIIRYEDTIWQEQNAYPNVVAYIQKNDLVHQCVILRKSFDPSELTTVLEAIRGECNLLMHDQEHRELKEDYRCEESRVTDDHHLS